MLDQNDSQLLTAYSSEGSEEAFAVLVQRHIDLVYSVALRRLGNPHQAEEVTQAVFIVLARKAGGLRAGTVVEGWLYETARLTASSMIRSEIRRQRREQEAFMQSSLDEVPPEAAWEKLAPLLEQALGGLNEKDRAAIILRFFKGKSIAETAEVLGAKTSATQKRIGRAVEKMRHFFNRRGLKISAGLLIACISANSIHAAPTALAATVTAVTAVKGTAAATSILTLTKTTLKIMAWTKIKTAAVTAVIVVTAAASVWTTERLIVTHDPAGVPGLIGWWKLDDGNDSSVKDTSHLFTGHRGKMMNNPKSVPGQKGEALSFNGQNQYVALGDIYKDSYRQLSIACWVKHPKGSWQNVVERSRWDDPDGIGLLMDYFGESIDFGHYGNFVKSKTIVQDNAWHHVVGTLAPEGSAYRYSIYVDGELDNTTVLPIGLKATKKAWTIGARYDKSWYYQGAISDVRLYDRALTATDVRKLYRVKK